MSFVEFTGRARLGKRTKSLVSRLGPDDVGDAAADPRVDFVEDQRLAAPAPG